MFKYRAHFGPISDEVLSFLISFPFTGCFLCLVRSYFYHSIFVRIFLCLRSLFKHKVIEQHF